MSVVINTNTAATTARSNLAFADAMFQRSLNRLSSGARIINASDDAGGLAVSMKLASAATRSGAANDNVGNTTSYLQQQDSNLKTATKVLDRMSELWTLYQDPAKNATDRTTYDDEFKALQIQLSSLTKQTFNDIKLFGSTGSGIVESLKVSEDGGQIMTIQAKDLADSSTGVGAVSDSTGSGSLGSVLLNTLDTAIGNVATMRANNGAEQSRLGFAGEVLTTNKTNLEAAYSRIVDVDVAEESTQLARWNLLVQTGAAMLSQANTSAQSALKLLQ
jgi:flagellin